MLLTTVTTTTSVYYRDGKRNISLNEKNHIVYRGLRICSRSEVHDRREKKTHAHASAAVFILLSVSNSKIRSHGQRNNNITFMRVFDIPYVYVCDVSIKSRTCADRTCCSGYVYSQYHGNGVLIGRHFQSELGVNTPNEHFMF